MNSRPVRVFEIALAAALITAINLALLLWAVRQRASTDLSRITASLATDTAPAQPTRQGQTP